jgi:hypothetical protein
MHSKSWQRPKKKAERMKSECGEVFALSSPQEAFQNDPWHLQLYARKAVEIR